MLFWVTGDFNGSLQTEAKEMVNSRYLAMIEAAFYIQKWQPFAKPHQCVEPLNQGEKIQTTLFFERLWEWERVSIILVTMGGLIMADIVSARWFHFVSSVAFLPGTPQSIPVDLRGSIVLFLGLETCLASGVMSLTMMFFQCHLSAWFIFLAFLIPEKLQKWSHNLLWAWGWLCPCWIVSFPHSVKQSMYACTCIHYHSNCDSISFRFIAHPTTHQSSTQKQVSCTSPFVIWKSGTALCTQRCVKVKVETA